MMQYKSEDTIDFPAVEFFKDNQPKDPSPGEIIDFELEMKYRMMKSFDEEKMVEVSREIRFGTPKELKNLARASSILGAALLHHYVLGAPSPKEDLLFSTAEFLTNTVAEYLPKSIMENYHKAMNTSGEFEGETTKVNKFQKKKMFFL